jgi:uncharacterized membrane protein YbhN (UPF0104 family)
MNSREGPQRLRFILLLLLSVATIAGLAYYLYANADKLLRLLRISAHGVLSLFALSLAFPVINGLINTQMFRGLGARISHREGFLLGAVATLANQLPLPGGIVTRGVYLKHRYGLSYAGYLSAQLALFFCTVAINGCVGLGLLLEWQFVRRASVSPVLIVAFAAMAASMLVFWLPLGHVKLPAAFLRWSRQTMEGWTLFRRKPALLMTLLALQIGIVALLAVRYWVAFRMLSQSVTGGQVLLLSSASVLTQLISFAPGGLGVREAIVGVVATALGFDLTVSIAAVELDRLIMTFTVVLVGWVSGVLLGRQVSDNSTSSRSREG